MANETVSIETYYRHMRRAMADRSYFNLFRESTLIPNLGKLEAMLLSDLINRSEMMFRRWHRLMEKGKKKLADKIKITPDGYFRCSYRFLQSVQHPPIWSDKEQERYIPRLMKLGFVHTKRKGNDGVRWIRVDLLALNLELDKLFGFPQT